jgi:hypothetical protein
MDVPVIVCLLILGVAGFFSTGAARAAVITFEQIDDSLIVSVYHEDRVAARQAGAGGRPELLAALAGEAGIAFDSIGVTIAGRQLPWAAITVAGRIRQAERGWFVALDTLPAGQPVNDDFCAGQQAVVLQSGDFIFGSVFLWQGTIDAAGEIGGNVINLGGPVHLHPGAVVRGSVLALGGIVDQQAPAKVYGGIYSDVKDVYHPVAVSRQWEFEGERYGFKPSFTYDKVDGACPGLEVYFQDTWMTPKIGLWTGYAFTSHYQQYRLYFVQRLSTSRDIRVGGEYFHLTDSEDKRFVYALENTLVALLANEDYRDYYGRQGGLVWAAFQPKERHTAMLTYENYDYRWREAHPDLWSLLWSGRDFRDNYGALEGAAAYLLDQHVFERKISLVRLDYRIDAPERDRYKTGAGYRLDGFWEIGGGVFKGDWSFSRVFAEGAGWYDFGKRHRVLLQVQGGMAQNDVSAPKLFYLGGPASLRGYPVKRYFGDEMFLATMEYAVRFWENAITDASLVLFGDVGRIGFNQTSAQFWSFDEFKSDIGVALDFGGGFRLAVAKALKDSDLEPVITVRVKAGL